MAYLLRPGEGRPANVCHKMDALRWCALQVGREEEGELQEQVNR
jgi:hypothetical protein